MAPVLGSTQSALMSPVRMLSGVANNFFKSGSYAARMSGALAEKHMAWKWHAISSLSSPEFRRELLQPNIDIHAAKDGLLGRLQEKLNPISSPLDQMQMMDLNMWLPDNMLSKKDRMTMAASIEARVPFLDHKLVEFGLSIPHHLRMHKLTGKWIIRQAMKDMMPSANVNRRKTGWPIPLDHWFRQDMKTLVGDVLLGDTTKQRGIYHPQAVQKMLETHWAGKAQYGRQIFLLLCMEMWLRAYN
jgi:asparagine synthetase B (glutamine-hydrolysing)